MKELRLLVEQLQKQLKEVLHINQQQANTILELQEALAESQEQVNYLQRLVFGKKRIKLPKGK
jgi:hypothetical protein